MNSGTGVAVQVVGRVQFQRAASNGVIRAHATGQPSVRRRGVHREVALLWL
jgi:hypothetical protein